MENFDDIFVTIFLTFLVAFLLGAIVGGYSPILNKQIAQDQLGTGYAKSICEAQNKTLDKLTLTKGGFEGQLETPIIKCKAVKQVPKTIDGQGYLLES